MLAPHALSSFNLFSWFKYPRRWCFLPFLTRSLRWLPVLILHTRVWPQQTTWQVFISFYFDFPPRFTSPESLQHFIVFLISKEGSVNLFFALSCLGRCTQNLVNSPQCCMDFILFFVCFWIVGSVLLLSYPHLIFKNLLCLWAICLPAVPMWLLWCSCDLLSVCVCWWPCMWNVEGFLQNNPQIRPLYQLIGKKKVEHVFMSVVQFFDTNTVKDICVKSSTGPRSECSYQAEASSPTCISANWWQGLRLGLELWLRMGLILGLRLGLGLGMGGEASSASEAALTVQNQEPRKKA